MKRFILAGGVLFATLLAIAIYLLCVPYIMMSSTSVTNVRQAETFVLGERTGNPHTYSITIRGSGEVDGQATIALLLNGTSYKVAELKGKVDFEWGGDWYSETAEIRYEPVNVRSGKVILHYRFHKI